MGSVSTDSGAVAPELSNVEPHERVDHIDAGLVEFGSGDVLIAGRRDFVGADGTAEVPRHSVGAHVGAVGERDDRVAAERVSELGV